MVSRLLTVYIDEPQGTEPLFQPHEGATGKAGRSFGVDLGNVQVHQKNKEKKTNVAKAFSRPRQSLRSSYYIIL
jgi:hypothetical protein